MRAYTLALLSRLNPDGTPIVESEILAWANKRLKEEEKEEVEIRSFQDKSIKTAVPILRLVDAIKPGAVNWSIVIKGETLSNEVGDIDLRFYINLNLSGMFRECQILCGCCEKDWRSGIRLAGGHFGGNQDEKGSVRSQDHFLLMNILSPFNVNLFR